MRQSLWVLALLGGLAILPGLSPAQTGLSTVRVDVTDPSGRAVPGASVVLSEATRPPRTLKTDVQGQSTFDRLAPGSYSIAVTAKGFAIFQVADLAVAAGSRQIITTNLILAATSEKVTVTDQTAIDLDPSSNASAQVLRKNELHTLSDDRADLLADLQALAGPAAGPNGGQIYIDGFTGGRMPPKQSIREVRINQNPFAAQFDRTGQGRIEIFTKPGAEDFHGQFLFQFSDRNINSRNPFVTTKPPYQRRQFEGDFGGPLGKHTSFSVDYEYRNTREDAFINGFILDSNLNVQPFSQAVVTPLSGVELNGRIDHQLAKNHTLTVSYGYTRDSNDNQGIGGFTLASRAYKVLDTESDTRVTETWIVNERTVNESRLRYRRLRTDETGKGSSPAISVLDAFTSGGPPLSSSYNHQDRYEFNNFTTRLHGRHTVKWGGLIRGVSLNDRATQNYFGTFTFTSLDAYRTTLLGLSNGLTAAQIRAAGGGASQFSISGGTPLASVNQFDVGFFAQDDFKVRSNLTLSGGLRFEAQNHTGDHSDFGPRMGFALALGKPGSKAPKNVIRGGFGMFYDRLGEGLTLDALRLDGIHQLQFVIPFPDFYPAAPSVQTLGASAQPQALRRTDARWQSPRMLQAALGFERQLPKGITIATNFVHSRGIHSLRSRNINAPAPGNGIRPFGGVNNIYEYESSGRYRQSQLITNVNAKVSPKLTLSGSYVLGYAHSDSDGAGTFPANQYDLATEYGRAGFDIRHRVQFNGSVSLPHGFRVSPFMTIASGRPYNITIGRDVNGDSLFNDRPAIATDLSRTSVIRTPLGAFDTAPLAGQRIVPRNYLEGPGQVAANIRVAKAFTFGEGGKGGKKPSGDPKVLTFTVNARNVLNHPNFGSPNGNLSSLLFGHSTSLLGGGNGGNRRLDLQMSFDF